MTPEVKRYDILHLKSEGGQHTVWIDYDDAGKYILYADHSRIVEQLADAACAYQNESIRRGKDIMNLEADTKRLRELLELVLVWHTGNYDAGDDCEMKFPEAAIRKELSHE
jgi:hypothetical protein